MTDTSLSPRALLERWDHQQTAYVAHREQRFQSMLDVLRLHLDEPFHVLDLACGPGSLANLARPPGILGCVRLGSD